MDEPMTLYETKLAESKGEAPKLPPELQAKPRKGTDPSKCPPHRDIVAAGQF